MPEFSSVMEYQKQSINTMSKGELLIRLYDELLKNIRCASLLFKDKNSDAAKKCTGKVRRIIHYLNEILDRSYSLSGDLEKIYDFLNTEVFRAELRGDHEALDKIVPLVQELRDTWVQANKLSHMESSQKGAV
ncbi:MAG: flagellar export chaperone FliS [Bacillota bacterium]|nr:flagellar export chaperone FliS [Bacillota bacterium]